MGDLQTDPDRILAAFCSACTDRGTRSATWRGEFVACGQEARTLKRCPDCSSGRLFFDRITEKALLRLTNQRKGIYEKETKQEEYGQEGSYPIEAGAYA